MGGIEVTVCEPVARPGDLRSRERWFARQQLRRNGLDRFADLDQADRDGVEDEPVMKITAGPHRASEPTAGERRAQRCPQRMSIGAVLCVAEGSARGDDSPLIWAAFLLADRESGQVVEPSICTLARLTGLCRRQREKDSSVRSLGPGQPSPVRASSQLGGSGGKNGRIEPSLLGPG